MARKYEKSSGGIVYRKNDNKIEILLLKWTNSKNNEEYVIPKWHIEEWEIAKQAAIREISEEAGLKQEDLEVKVYYKIKLYIYCLIFKMKSCDR